MKFNTFSKLQKYIKYYRKNLNYKVIKCKITKENTTVLNCGYSYFVSIKMENKNLNSKIIIKSEIFDFVSPIFRAKEYREGRLYNIEYIGY